MALSLTGDSFVAVLFDKAATGAKIYAHREERAYDKLIGKDAVCTYCYGAPLLTSPCHKSVIKMQWGPIAVVAFQNQTPNQVLSTDIHRGANILFFHHSKQCNQNEAGRTK